MSDAPSYEPRPGTVAFRALAYLETLPPGSEVMSAALAEAIGAPPNNVTPCLEPALQAGRLFRRQRDDHVRSPFWWSLTDRSTAPRPPRPRVEVPVFLANGHAARSEPEGAAAMRIALWDDGTLHVRREPAELVLFTAAETRQLLAYLKRVAGDA